MPMQPPMPTSGYPMPMPASGPPMPSMQVAQPGY
jgi:hypothetical protein